MKILIVGDKNKETQGFFEKAQTVAKNFKDAKIELVFESTDFYNLPLVVINNIIVSSGSILNEEELKELFENPPKGCPGNCGDCGGCS